MHALTITVVGPGPRRVYSFVHGVSWRGELSPGGAGAEEDLNPDSDGYGDGGSPGRGLTGMDTRSSIV
jgi:hypothetical protein